MNDQYYGFGKLTTRDGNSYEGYWIKNKPMNQELTEKINNDKVNLLEYFPLPTPMTYGVFT